jgi:hypothetical protein
MKKYILLLLLVAQSIGYSQTVNDYKAVIVPLKFDFLKSENQYRLNTFSKYNLKNAGFEAFYSNESTPQEFSDRCDLLYLNVEEDNGFLVTKLFVTLKDCNDKIIFQTPTAKSKEKDYQAAYTECLNEAFKSIDALHYKYNGSKKNTQVVSKAAVNEVVKPQVVESVKAVVAVENKIESTNATYLYAQPTVNGYQLIDTTPKVIMKLYKTAAANCFIAIKDQEQGVLISTDSVWFFQYYKSDTLISEKVAVKF